jgi:hypothetical protein
LISCKLAGRNWEDKWGKGRISLVGTIPQIFSHYGVWKRQGIGNRKSLVGMWRIPGLDGDLGCGQLISAGYCTVRAIMFVAVIVPDVPVTVIV